MFTIDGFDFANLRRKDENNVAVKKIYIIHGTEEDTDVFQRFISSEIPFESNEEKELASGMIFILKN